MSISIQEKIQKAEEYKSAGNACFKEGNFSRAKAQYGKCLAYCTGLPGSSRNNTGYEKFQKKSNDDIKQVTEEEDAIAAKLELICHQNIATCFLKMGQPSDALTHCNKALKLDRDGSAWKAKLRKGEAYMQMGRHDDAKLIFESLLLDPAVTDEGAITTINKLIAQTNKLIKAHNEKEKRIYKNLFSGDAAGNVNNKKDDKSPQDSVFERVEGENRDSSENKIEQEFNSYSS